MTDQTAAPTDSLRQRLAKAVDNAWRTSLETHAFGPRARAEIADAVLAVVQPELDRLADYENRITWETNCGSCARILDVSIREHERAERAEAAIDRVHNLRSIWQKAASAKDDAVILVGVAADMLYGALQPAPAPAATEATEPFIDRPFRSHRTSEPAPDAGPTVREAAADDRLWPLQKHGE